MKLEVISQSQLNDIYQKFHDVVPYTYIANYCSHYEPVSSMVSSFAPTYGNGSNDTLYCQLVE